MVLDWGVHLLDQILWLVDSPVKDVKADLSYILGERSRRWILCFDHI